MDAPSNPHHMPIKWHETVTSTDDPRPTPEIPGPAGYFQEPWIQTVCAAICLKSGGCLSLLLTVPNA